MESFLSTVKSEIADRFLSWRAMSTASCSSLLTCSRGRSDGATRSPGTARSGCRFERAD
jgi:hypothetical protein